LTHRELTAEEKGGGYPFEETGGAGNFLNFLVHELIPFIEAKYRTDTKNRALVGWSLAAPFILYATFQQPGLFPSMIAISPSVDKVILDLEAAYASNHSALPLRLFLGIEAPVETPDSRQGIAEIHAFVQGIEQFASFGNTQPPRLSDEKNFL
jgi:predicted alpha/beta superfamily hydrolase